MKLCQGQEATLPPSLFQVPSQLTFNALNVFFSNPLLKPQLGVSFAHPHLLCIQCSFSIFSSTPPSRIHSLNYLLIGAISFSFFSLCISFSLSLALAYCTVVGGEPTLTMSACGLQHICNSCSFLVDFPPCNMGWISFSAVGAC